MKLKDAIEKLTAEVNAKQARLTELEKLLDTSGAELMRYRKRYGWLPSQEDKALPHDA
ncbi:MAG TPA: hypothetical protein VFQ05_05385 [Candidatus Eisenbacteria bacterium]|nr:hypothetical protein [Candidatus Eisenbacteria bacterium]